MNLSQYLETMKNLPERFSNLNFWRGVRKLRDKIVDTFEYVGEWGTSIESSIHSIRSRINRAFSYRDVDIKSNVKPVIYPYPIPEGPVPYPRVEQCIMRFDGLNTTSVTTGDIIESASFTGMFNIDGRTITFAQSMPLTPLYSQSSSNISFISTPIPLYKTSSGTTISQASYTITIRCRSIPTK